MKRPNFLSLMVVLMVLNACSSQQNHKDLSLENVPVVKIDVLSRPQELFHLDSLIDSTSIKIIPLETDLQMAVFGNVDYLHVLKDHYLIGDKQLNRILLFRSDGSFERLIGQQGRGPEEFHNINDLSYNPYSERVEIYDRTLKFTRYELPSGKFVDSRVRISSDFNLTFYHPVGPDDYVVYNGLRHTEGRSDLRYRLGYVKDQKVVWKKFEYSSQEEGLSFISSRRSLFWTHGDRVGFYERFIPVLYDVDEKGVEPRLYFDFMDGNSPPFDVNNLSAYFNVNEKEEKKVWLSSVMESDQHLLVGVSARPNAVTWCFILRKMDNGYDTVAIGLGGHIYVHGMKIELHTIQDNYVYGMIKAQYVVEKQKELKLRDPNSLTPFEHQLLALKVEDTDNDLICSFLLK
jgi:hypothetical protein